jgi:hypothetical protein
MERSGVHKSSLGFAVSENDAWHVKRNLLLKGKMKGLERRHHREIAGKL